MPNITQTQEQTTQTTNNNTNFNDEFLQWWIDKAGVGAFDESKGFYRTDAMSDYDYRIGKNLYTGYQNKQNLEKEYLTAQEQLKKQTAQAQAQSYAEKVLMQKYLPELLNVQGYSGNVGLTEDAVLGLNRNYNNSLNTIQSNYQDNLNDLTNDYNANRLSIDNSISAQNDALISEQNQIKLSLASEWYAKYYEDYNSLLNDEDATIDDWNKFIQKVEEDENLGAYKDLIYDDIIEGRDDFIKNEEQEKIDNKIVSGKQTITYNGQNYKLTKALKTDANEITQNNSFTKKLNELGFEDPYDERIPNGTTIQIKCDNSGKDKFDFWDDVFGAGIFLKSLWGSSGWSIYNKTITYYNGKWYESEKE